MKRNRCKDSSKSPADIHWMYEFGDKSLELTHAIRTGLFIVGNTVRWSRSERSGVCGGRGLHTDNQQGVFAKNNGRDAIQRDCSWDWNTAGPSQDVTTYRHSAGGLAERCVQRRRFQVRKNKRRLYPFIAATRIWAKTNSINSSTNSASDHRQSNSENRLGFEVRLFLRIYLKQEKMGYRPRAKIVKLNKFSLEEINEFLKKHPD